MSPILSQLQWLLLIPDDVENGYSVFLGYNLAKDLILEVMMLLETGIRVSTYKRYQISVVNQSLMKENIKTRYDALKNQLDPHFLFNSLNTLNGLIGVDDDKAHEYVENLSSVFRYTLRSKTICTLDEEIEFVNSYVDLLKIRYGENLVVHYNIDERFRKYYLMPVSIQLLVENAIKHNIISNKKPLFILIESTEQGFISVKNLINLKLKNVQNNGVGLANLANRYSLLFQKTINIQNKDGFFSVEIPLIEKMDVKP
ncbi:histidine kinase [Bacteroides sp. OttesenSCG-928-J23]|nr:histidine kinase [Bacteroides sp. OttesenSCG-928-J23]MDL2299714.1 histidine kinase [Bacteroides sp. OttesenSCG-928-E20]